MITPDRFRKFASKFAAKKIAVIGDFFLDRYLFFDTKYQEKSVETGHIANQVVNVVHSPGAAGNIVSNLKKLGAGAVLPIGYTGDDGEGYELRKDIKAMGCPDTYLLTFPTRHTCTYTKPQNIAIKGLGGEKERYDIKNRIPFSKEEELKIITAINAVIPYVDGIIIADQTEVEADNCGTVTAEVRKALIILAKKYPEKIFWADSRLRADKFKYMILKPNEDEAIKCTLGKVRKKEANVISAGETLCKKTGKPVFLTRSEQGIWIFDRNNVTKIPAVPVTGEIDCTGAGDSLTSGAVLALCCGADYTEAAQIGALASSISIKMLGQTGYATQADIINKLNDKLLFTENE